MKKTVILILTFMFLFTACKEKTNIIESFNGSDIKLHLISPLAIESQNFLVYEKGMYYTQNQVLYYYDDTVGQSVPVCSRPECTHQDDTCTAYMPDISSSLFTNGEKLLYTQFGTIRKMNFDGTENELLYTQEEAGFIYKKYLGDNYGNVYFVETKINEDRKINELKRLNIENKEITVIYQTDKSMQINGAYENNVVFKSYTDEMILKYDLIVLNIDSLKETIIRENSKYDFVVDDSIYTLSQDGRKLTEENLVTGENTVVSENVSDYDKIVDVECEFCFDEYILLSVGAREYIVNRQTGESKQFLIELTSEYMESVPDDYVSPILIPISVLAQIDDSLIAYIGDRETTYKQLDPYGVTVEIPTVEGVFAKISIFDLVNNIDNYTIIN